LVAAVDAKSWQHYLGGIIQFHCDNDLNHAAQIIGYDLTGLILLLNLLSRFSYLIQNSWIFNPELPFKYSNAMI
jgi:hypothetical protein